MVPAWIEGSSTVKLVLHACRRHFAYAMLFSALLNLLFIAPMLYMLQVYGRVLPTHGQTTLMFLTLVLALCLATLAALDAIRSRLLVRASVRVDDVMAGHVMRATLLQADSAQRLARQAVRELDILRQSLTGPAMLGLLDAPWVPIYVIVAFLINAWIGVLTVMGTLVIVLLAWRNERSTREPLEKAHGAAGRSHATYDASVASSDVIRALGMREAMVVGQLDSRRAMIDLQSGASLASAQLAAQSKFVRLLLQSAALGLGALLAIDSKISPGSVFASMFIVGRALGPVDQLVGGWRTIIQARGAIAVLDELFDITPPQTALTRLPAPLGRLTVEGLTVAGHDQKPLLFNIRFAVAPGEVVAVVGPSGAGKSTLVRAVAGAIRPSGGEVRFDGAAQGDWDSEQLAAHVGFMPQETRLFAGTVKDNIARFRSLVDDNPAQVDAQAVAAARLAGAHEMILKLAGGYNHLIDMGGRGMSAGQAQRIALARALFGAPRYAILDEPNASLDAEGDSQLVATVEELKRRGTTVLVVAHRLSVLPVVDKILVVQDGQLALFADRDEALRRLAPPPQRVAMNG